MLLLWLIYIFFSIFFYLGFDENGFYLLLFSTLTIPNLFAFLFKVKEAFYFAKKYFLTLRDAADFFLVFENSLVLLKRTMIRECDELVRDLNVLEGELILYQRKLVQGALVFLKKRYFVFLRYFQVKLGFLHNFLLRMKNTYRACSYGLEKGWNSFYSFLLFLQGIFGIKYAVDFFKGTKLYQKCVSFFNAYFNRHALVIVETSALGDVVSGLSDSSSDSSEMETLRLQTAIKVMDDALLVENKDNPDRLLYFTTRRLLVPYLKNKDLNK